MNDEVRFDRGPAGQRCRFRDPHEVIRADAPEDLPAAFAAITRAQAEGRWLAGFAAYELGYCLTERLAPLLPEHRDLPLLAFGVYDAPEDLPPPVSEHAPQIELGEPLWSEARYAEAFETVHDYIGAGDCYQVNLTFPVPVMCDAPPEALYAALSSAGQVPHGADVALAGVRLLSRSPELFFRVEGGKIVTRPMKGTRPRGATAEEDAALKADLIGAEKDRAENLMIVDLLRNDISRICAPGSVKVPRLFEVETYRSVHQMISEIEGELVPGADLPEILRAMFPCGSVTGAPKIRAMEIIRELEPDPRGIYCGAIGWTAPDGRMEFNVAIRTLMQTGPGQWRVNVGGGLVYDSTAHGEYEEALWKTRFLQI